MLVPSANTANTGCSDTLALDSDAHVNFPTEILEQIFLCIHDFHKNSKSKSKRSRLSFRSSSADDTDLHSSPFDPLSKTSKSFREDHPTLPFPYYLSRVCCKWNDICLNFPQFWTKVIIDVGPNSSSILQLTRELKVFDGRHLDVWITRTDGFGGEDALECRRVIAFMRILAPHIHRCTSLLVNTVRQESLAHISDILVGPVPDLQTIRLVCGPNRNGVAKSDYMASSHGVDSPPRSRQIYLDSSLILRNVPWPWISTPLIQDIEITSPLSQTQHSTRLSFVQTFHVLSDVPNLLRLTLRNVKFDLRKPRRRSEKLVPGLLSRIKTLNVEDLEPRVVASIMPLVYDNDGSLDVIRITRCRVGDVSADVMAPTYALMLRDLDARDDLIPMLRGSSAMWLSVHECPSFTSDTLTELAQYSEEICPYLEDLEITGPCVANNISIASIKNLIATRYDLYQECYGEIPDEEDDNIAADEFPHMSYISMLCIGGFRTIDSNDLTWLRSRVDHVFFPDLIW